jgi:hypothetical protein
VDDFLATLWTELQELNRRATTRAEDAALP